MKTPPIVSPQERQGERGRHHAGLRLARAAGGRRAPEGAHGPAADPWYTLTDAFDAHFGVDGWHGTNAFVREGEEILRTRFVNRRGDEAMGSTRSYLDSGLCDGGAVRSHERGRGGASDNLARTLASEEAR